MRSKAAVVFVGLLALLALAAGALGADEGGKGGDLESAAAGGYTFRREGGIAGFCDVVVLTADGGADVSSCASDPPRPVAQVRLSTAQASLIADWVAHFASFSREQTDPATADAMTLSVEFDGQGDAQPDEGDVAAMFDLAQQVLAEASR